jgi:HAMP domain-containing protein
MPKPAALSPPEAANQLRQTRKRPSQNGIHDDSLDVELLQALLAFRSGDFSTRLPAGRSGIHGKIADAFNDVLAMSERRARETARVCHVVGKEGRLRQRMSTTGLVGGWSDEVQALNTLMDDLVRPTTEVTRTIGAVAKGDLGQSMALEVDGRALEGEFLHSAKLVNRMIDQLTLFTSEVTRVAREVGTEGKLGGQAQVKGTSGVWKDLTESVNQMAGNLTAQVRNIADVTIAVVNGDLSKKSPWTSAAKSCSSRKRSIRWSTSCGRLHRRSRAWRAKSAPRAGWVARLSCRAWRARGRI